VAQETRGWVEERNATVSQRSKEYAHDYRYFPEPDLPPLAVDPAWVEEVRGRLPEMPAERRARFVSQYGLPLNDAAQLTGAKATADYFEKCLGLPIPQSPSAKADDGGVGAAGVESRAKALSNWVLVEMGRLLNLSGTDITEDRVTPAHLVELVGLIDSGTLSSTLAKTVLEESFNSGSSPGEIVKEKGYVQISDTSVVESAVEEAINANPQAVADYLKGKETAAKFLVGQVMKITKGKAKPDLVNQLVNEKLEAIKAS
jgi:aspartyl-tRNA(Asn)/glutamyl-tRNA(Gln) amidotransferase subunit B